MKIYSIYGIPFSKEGISVELCREAKRCKILTIIKMILLVPSVTIAMFLYYQLLVVLGYADTILSFLIVIIFLVGLYLYDSLWHLLETIKLVSLTSEDRLWFLQLLARQTLDAKAKLKEFCAILKNAGVK